MVAASRLSAALACAAVLAAGTQAQDDLADMGDAGAALADLMGDQGEAGFGGGMPPDMDDEMMQQLLAQMGGGGGMMGMPGMGGMGGMDGPPAEPVKADVKFILCDTCKALVHEAAKRVKALRDSLPNTKISEERIDTMLEQSCQVKEEAGDWISTYDIVKTADNRLELDKQSTSGRCRGECKTIELACSKIFEEVSTLLSEKLYLALPEDEIVEQLCVKELRRKKGACGKPYPALPEDWEDLEDFQPKSEQDIAMDELNRKIRSTPGLGSFNPMQDEL